MWCNQVVFPFWVAYSGRSNRSRHGWGNGPYGPRGGWFTKTGYSVIQVFCMVSAERFVLVIIFPADMMGTTGEHGLCKGKP